MIDQTKRVLKSLLLHRGIRVYGPGSLPKGVDLWHDINRCGLGQRINRVVDVGANVGHFTAHALDLNDGLSVDCIEIETNNFRCLSDRFANNERVRLHHCGAGSENGTVKLNPNEQSTFHSLVPSLNMESSAAQSQEVEIRRIDQFISLNNDEPIGLLKTDTEGFDLEVLRGAKELFEARKIQAVVSEVGFHEDDTRHSPFQDVHHILVENDFDLFGFYDQGKWWRNGCLDYANAFFLHKNWIDL